MNSLIRATNLRGYHQLVKELGGESEPLLSRFHLPLEVESEPDALISFEAVAGLLRVSAEELGCPDFGMQISQWQGLDILGPVAVIARNAQTVQEGLGAIARYLYLHSPALNMTVGPSTVPGVVRFTFAIAELPLIKLQQSYELSLANAAQIIRLLTGGDGPLSVSFLHAQVGPDAAYADVLGCEVRFEQDWCGFDIPLSLASKRIDAADPETRRLATRYLETEFPAPDARLLQQVANLARRLIPTGQCSADAIAEELALHPRTLQRLLAVEGATCQELIDKERQQLAIRYLAEPRLHLNQVTGLIGYSEQSSLNRSCRRWFGRTPRQYRADVATPTYTLSVTDGTKQPFHVDPRRQNGTK
ncbi:AraC family transcriptional regulator [Aeromicrobium sp. A1-2]|nr:AraC family transcriptional regulator [Aeromicrobium sp. A1-2]